MNELDEELADHDADEVQKELVKEAARIRKRFNLDTFQIIATRLEGNALDGGGQTRRFCAGVGNHYARHGAAHSWLIEDEKDERKAPGE